MRDTSNTRPMATCDKEKKEMRYLAFIFAFIERKLKEFREGQK